MTTPVPAAESALSRLALRKNSDVLLEFVPVAGRAIADVGCGDGAIARLMARGGARMVLGLEVTERQLSRALAADPEPGVVFMKAGGEALPIADGMLDAVVFFNSLHHVPEPLMDQALAEAARVLRPGGLVYVGEPIAEGPFFALVQPVDDETRVRALALERIRAAGRHGLIQRREEVYRHTVRLGSFEALRERIASANPEREARMATLEPALREAFQTLGSPQDDGGRAFDQPMRATLLEKRPG